MPLLTIRLLHHFFTVLPSLIVPQLFLVLSKPLQHKSLSLLLKILRNLMSILNILPQILNSSHFSSYFFYENLYFGLLSLLIFLLK
jgi:hypothetical protein